MKITPRPPVEMHEIACVETSIISVTQDLEIGKAEKASCRLTINTSTKVFQATGKKRPRFVYIFRLFLLPCRKKQKKKTKDADKKQFYFLGTFVLRAPIPLASC